jgi:hypothetical protein
VALAQVKNLINPDNVADPGCLSLILIFHPGSRVKRFPDGSASASKNLSILTQKIVSKLSVFITDSVADPDPGSGAFLTPGSGIRNEFFSGSRISDPGSRIPDLGSRIPRPYFEELFDNFFGKKFFNSLKIGPRFFSLALQD